MPTLLADIGGTHARFALLPVGAVEPGPAVRVALDAFADAEGLLRARLAAETGLRPRAAVLAVAGPVAGNRVVLTNRGWRLDGAALCAALGLRAVVLVNDFAALAWALPTLREAELLHLGGPRMGIAAAPRSVIGPGTGLGVALFAPPATVIATEGGHATLAAGDAHEAAVIAELHQRFGDHVSAERGALSGQGIEALHAALGGHPGLGCPAIMDRAIAGTDRHCAEAIALHCAMLGAFAGDVALLHGAQGGVYLAGGIAARIPGMLAGSDFRARFDAKGRMRAWVEAVPTWLIRDPEAAAMRGLAHLAQQGLAF